MMMPELIVPLSDRHQQVEPNATPGGVLSCDDGGIKSRSTAPVAGTFVPREQFSSTQLELVLYACTAEIRCGPVSCAVPGKVAAKFDDDVS